MSVCCSNFPNCQHTAEVSAIGTAMAHAARFQTFYDKFLECVKNTGAYAVYKTDGKQETLIPKGSTTHGIESHEVIEFRPLARNERRYLDGKRKRL